MRTFFCLLSVVFVLGVLPVAAQQPTITAVASVKQLHDAMIKPSSDAIFSVALETPRNEPEWIAVRNATVILAESGNLLMLSAPGSNRGLWMRRSQSLVDAGAMALKAAEARNAGALNKASDRTVIVCESCHVLFRNQDRKMPVK
jgi:hypothetical protein